MKRVFALALAVLFSVPLAAVAQTMEPATAPPAPAAPPPPPAGGHGRWGPPDPARMEQFRKMHDQMATIHKAERAKMLAALTPAHRTLLANVAGQLAIATDPNPDAAAAKLDASLSSSEKATILKIHQDARAQMKSAMQQMETSMKPPSGANYRYGSGPSRMGKRPPSDAGHILLMVAASGAMPMHLQMRGMRPMPGT